MKAFLSYRFGDDTNTIQKILKDNDVQVFDGMSDLTIGKSLQQAIKNSIKECDFVIIIYTEANSNIAFEAGVACALNKPILSIVSTNSTDEPDFLFDSILVRSSPDEYEKIKFSFDLFLKNIKPKTTSSYELRRSKYHKFYGGGEAIDIRYEKLNSLWKSLDDSHQNIENFFKEVFNQYNIKFVENSLSTEDRFNADFSIWSDALSSIMGNPILVEIKRNLNQNNVSTFLDQLTKFNNSYNYLIFYKTLKPESFSLPNSNKYLFIKIEDFLQKLKLNDFDNSIRIIRNEIAHKVN